MITVSTVVRFLLFNADAIRQVGRSRLALVVGLLFVLSAGFAREYDGEYLVAEPWHLLLPVAASIIGCTAMVILVACAAHFRGVRGVSVVETFLTFLSLYWMTAPLAWLYAIPVERLLAPGDATRANLTLLAIVALWRVALMVRSVQVVYGASLKAAFVPIILFSDILALLALRFVPGPVFMIMGGVRLNESEQIILGMRLMLGMSGVASLPVWLISYIAICAAKKRWQWYSDEAGSPGQSARVSLGCWLAVAASLLIWIPILPVTQPEQALRWESERLIHAGDFAKLSQLTREHPESSFPPHWDPPPRIGYGDQEPRVHRVVAGLVQHQASSWILDRYLEKMQGEAMGRFHYWIDLERWTDEELADYVDTVARLEDPSVIAKHYKQVLNNVPVQWELSDSRRESLKRLVALGEADEEAANQPSRDASE